jgi:ubiquitin-activating enzyme E1
VISEKEEMNLVLNKYVKVNYLKETKINELYDKLAGNYNVLIITEMLPEKEIQQLDTISRNNKICLIYSILCGLCSFVFTDFGLDFTIFDEFCIKKRKFYIKNIEKSEEGLVEILWNGKGNPYIQEYILFRDVEGMTEINYDENKKNIFKIKSKDPTSFYIGNTTNFSKYISGGYIEETALPKIMNYHSFQEILNEPFVEDNNNINHKKKFVYFIFRALMKFFDKKKRLPLPGNEQDFEEIKKLTKSFFVSINYDNSKSFEKNELLFDENLIKNLCFSCRAEIPCMTSLIGGIVCQEILKTTGKFRPINQLEIFNFTQYSSIIPEKEKYLKNNYKNFKSRYGDLISVFGQKIVTYIQNLNIFLAGAGAVGCEVLKNLSLLGIESGLVVDDDNIEISNLNRQFLFHEEDKGKSKALIASKSAKEINSDCQFNYIAKRISPENKYIFNQSYFKTVDFVFGAIDSSQGNYYLVRQCELHNKIFIKGATGGPQGKVESFIPDKTCSYNDIPIIPDDEGEKLPSCTRREFPGKIEDCLDNSRDLFDEYYATIVDDILKLFDPKEKFLELEVKNTLDKFNIINKYLYFIELGINEKNNDGKKTKAKKINNLEKELIKFGLLEFEKLFVTNIKQIYISHPLNETEESKTFWLNKRKPTELPFNIEDELSLSFLYNFLNIFSKLLFIPFIDNITKFKEKVNCIISEMNSVQNNESMLNYIDDSGILYNKLLKEIQNFKEKPELLEKIKNLQKINFEKDIPELGHVQFVHSYANLKAKSYKIPSCDKFYSLEYVGKIAPTTITSTAAVAGIMCLQMIGIIINQIYYWPKNTNVNVDEDEYNEELKETGLHNFCLNLKTNEYDFESLSELKFNGIWNINNVIPSKYNNWFKLNETGNKTIQEFNEYIKEKYGVNVTLILSAEDDRDIYEKVPAKKKTKHAQEKRKLMENISKQNLEEVYFNTAQKVCSKYKREKELFLKVKGIDDNGTYTEIPIIKYIINN